MVNLRLTQRWLALLIPCAAWAMAADAPTPVEITLTTGEVVAGQILEQNETSVLLQMELNIRGKKMAAQRRLAVKDISRIATVNDEYQTRLANLSPGPEAEAALARWCLQSGLRKEARAHAEKAIQAEAVNADARHLLHEMDLAQIDGQWTTVESWLTAKGLFRLEGKIIDAASKAKLDQVIATRNTANAELAKTKQDITSTTAKLKGLTEQATQLAQQRKDTTTAAANADKAKAAVEAAQKALDQANAQQAKAAQAKPPANQKNTKSTPPAPTASETAVRKAKEALATAQSAASAADPVKAKERLAKIDADLALNKSEQAKSNSALTAATAALPAKQTASDAAQAAWTKALAETPIVPNVPSDVIACVAEQAALIKSSTP